LPTNPYWFSNNYDIGLLPRQVLKNPQVFICNFQKLKEEVSRLAPEIPNLLLPKEIE